MRARDLLPWGRKSEGKTPQRSGNSARDLQTDINRAFEDFFRAFELSMPLAGPADLATDALPRIDIRETDKEVDIEAELPGMDESDIDVSVAEGALMIRGEKKAEHEVKGNGYTVHERSFGHVERTVPLPDGLDIDSAKATFKNGVLTIAIPKTAEAQAAVKRISVNTR